MAIAFHGPSITSAVEDMIRTRGVGGIVLRTENAPDASALARICADLQRIAAEAKIPPLFLAVDQEGGSVVRIASGMTVFPSQMALAATPDPVAAVQRSATITAEELRAGGVNWNLAPVADVNNEPLNPIIGNRSYGSDPQRVSTLVGAEYTILEDLNNGVQKPVQIRFNGADSRKLLALTNDFMTRLRQVPGAVDVGLSEQAPKDELKVELDRGLANQLGISVNDAAQAVACRRKHGSVPPADLSYHYRSKTGSSRKWI